MPELPAAARVAVARIEALLDEARDLPGLAASSDESAFVLRETERRYLPDTLGAYLAIPRSQRDDEASALLEAQLLQLERATAKRLAAFAATQRDALAANGTFLDGRFGRADSLPPAPLAEPQPARGGDAPSRTMVARFFERLAPAVAARPDAVLAAAAERFSTLLPALTTVKRGLFGGAPQAVSIDVPSGDAVLRYALQATRAGFATTVTKVVRGIALRTEPCDFDTWIAALVEDVGTYVERDRATRERLMQFIGR
ncbi:MAG: hypothetical protein NVS3B16_22530 [Vulcanimicrobiaceae bacterium]